MKSEYYFERLLQALKSGTIIAPPTVDIDLTNVCRQNCYYCNSAEFRASVPDVATIDDYFNLIDDLPEGVREIEFAGGGEPLDHPEASKIMNYAISQGYRIGIITNGTRLRHMEFTKNSYPMWIGIDMDSGNESDYWQIRRGSFKKTVASISEKIEEFKLYGTKFTFKYLINDFNNTESQLYEAIDVAKDIGFDEFLVRVAYFDDHIIYPPTSVSSWQELAGKLQKRCDTVDIKLLEHFSKQIDYVDARGKGKTFVKKCFAPLFFPLFTSDGSIYWCCEHRGEEEYIIGNWIKDGFEPLFNPEVVDKMKNFIKYIKCAHQCRYYEYNAFAEKVDEGLDTDDNGMSVGFF